MIRPLNMTKIQKLIWFLAFLWTLFAFATLLTYISTHTAAQTLKENQDPAQKQDLLVYRAPENPMEMWLDALQSHENCPLDGIVDSNGLRSFGAFCYQMNTFIPKMQDYRSELAPDAEDDELLNFLDSESERRLTRVILRDHPEEYWRWCTTVRGTKKRKGIGLPPGSVENAKCSLTISYI